MAYSPILVEHVPLVRRILAASPEPKVREVGRDGEILYLVEYDVTENGLDILDRLIAHLSSGEHPPGAESKLRNHRDALQPHVGKKLLKAEMQCAARRHQIYIDPVAHTVVDLIWGELPPNQAKNFDPRDRSTWLNMHLEWFKTVEEDAAYRDWLASTLFPPPKEFFDNTTFEKSKTLYQVEVQESLLEDAIYRGIQPATFQKAELNDAIRDASSELFGHSEAKWFHVNVHDNVDRVVEKFGRYSFDYPLVPVYILLLYHQAKEGGTTYAGVASAHREWVLLFRNGLHISVHGPKDFVDRVCSRLGLDPE